MGSPTPELSSPSSPSIPQSIRLLYGHSIAKDLSKITVSSKDNSELKKPDAKGVVGTDDQESWVAEAHFTNTSYQAKKMLFLLFINSEPFALDQSKYCRFIHC